MIRVINKTLPFLLNLKDGDSSAFAMEAKLKIVMNDIAGG